MLAPVQHHIMLEDAVTAWEYLNMLSRRYLKMSRMWRDTPASKVLYTEITLVQAALGLATRND